MVKCRDCRFVGENYMTGLHGQGIYKFAYCRWLVHECKIVDPDIDREYENFEVTDGKQSEEIS